MTMAVPATSDRPQRRPPACAHTWENHPPQVRFRCAHCRALGYRRGIRIREYRCRDCKVRPATQRGWRGTLEVFWCDHCRSPQPGLR